MADFYTPEFLPYWGSLIHINGSGIEFSCDETSTEPDPNEVVAQLPIAEAADAIDVCSICINAFEGNAPGKCLPCAHPFHEPCLCSWLSLWNFCPLCFCQVVPTFR